MSFLQCFGGAQEMKIFMARVVTLVGFAEGHSWHSTFSHTGRDLQWLQLLLGNPFLHGTLVQPSQKWHFAQWCWSWHTSSFQADALGTICLQTIHINIYIKSPNVLLAALGSFIHESWMNGWRINIRVEDFASFHTKIQFSWRAPAMNHWLTTSTPTSPTALPSTAGF